MPDAAPEREQLVEELVTALAHTARPGWPSTSVPAARSPSERLIVPRCLEADGQLGALDQGQEAKAKPRARA